MLIDGFAFTNVYNFNCVPTYLCYFKLSLNKSYLFNKNTYKITIIWRGELL